MLVGDCIKSINGTSTTCITQGDATKLVQADKNACVLELFADPVGWSAVTKARESMARRSSVGAAGGGSS